MPDALGTQIGQILARRYFQELDRLNGQSDETRARLSHARLREPTLAYLIALGIHEYRRAQMTALRAIPSDTRTAASRQNGKKGGRPRTRRQT